MVLVEEPDDLPELVLEAGGDRDLQCLEGVGPEEREAAEVDLEAPWADVLVHDRRERVVRVLLADRALQVLELQHPHRCGGIAEDRPLLRDARDERDGRRRRAPVEVPVVAVAVSVVAAVSSLLPPVRRTLPRISATATTAATARAMIRLRLRPLFSDGGFGTGGIGMQSACRPMPVRGQTVFNGGVDANQRRRRLVEAGIAITSELSLDAVLQTLVRIAAELTGARYSALGVIDRGGTELERFLTYGIDDATRAAIGELPRGRGILGVLIEDARPLRLSEISRDPRSVGFPPNHPPMHSFLGVPVMTRGVAFGNLYLSEKQPAGDFTEEDEEIVTLLAAQAAVAIVNAGSVQRDALRRAVQAQEAERRRLARELHDETGQALTSILLGLAAVERSESVEDAHLAAAALRDLVVETLQNVRRLAVELRPSALDDFGLEPALRRLGETVREGRALDVQVETRLGPNRLPADVETALYRIVQEALTNVVKHAGAEHVSVVVTRKAGSVVAMIEDDGRGFDRAGSPGRRPRAARDARAGRAARRDVPDRGCP